VFALAAVPAPQKTFDFSSETVGAEPKTMTPVVGVWVVAQDGENKVLMVDGSRWKQGQPAANLADKARALYGDRYAEFLDNVQSFAYFPYAVAKEIDDFREGEIRMRFKPLAGRIDQGAGILFNLKRNGDYLIVPRKRAGEQSCSISIRKRKEESREVDSQHAHCHETMAYVEGARHGKEGGGFPRR